MNEVIKQIRIIREMLCNLEIKGYENAIRLAAAIKTCDELLSILSNSLNNQNGVREDVTANAEGHTG